MLCMLNYDCFFCNKEIILFGSYSSFYYDVKCWLVVVKIVCVKYNIVEG